MQEASHTLKETHALQRLSKHSTATRQAPNSGSLPTHQPEGLVLLTGKESHLAQSLPGGSMASPPSTICPGASPASSPVAVLPATPSPYCTLDTGPCPRWPPCQPAHCIWASAQISNVMLSERHLCLTEHRSSQLTSPLPDYFPS